MATTLVKEKEIRNLIRRTVIESVQGVLTDPDYGFEITESVARRLKKYSKNIPFHRLISLSELKHKYL